MPLSIFIWLLFEAYNFVLNNWSYTNAPLQMWQRWLGYAVSFATVLPGIFITSDIVETLFRPASRSPASEYERLSAKPDSASAPLFLAIGLTLTIAPLLWPRYLFPAVWLGPIFLLDPLLEKVRIQSLSLNIFSGYRIRVWSLMLGGLLCGVMWEFWNFWAGSKWNHRAFDRWKVFEMPILGFRFPPSPAAGSIICSRRSAADAFAAAQPLVDCLAVCSSLFFVESITTWSSPRKSFTNLQRERRPCGCLALIYCSLIPLLFPQEA